MQERGMGRDTKRGAGCCGELKNCLVMPRESKWDRNLYKKTVGARDLKGRGGYIDLPVWKSQHLGSRQPAEVVTPGQWFSCGITSNHTRDTERNREKNPSTDIFKLQDH